jgi:metal-responsive CopG/Arc/MetJ family transcriptional regulator
MAVARKRVTVSLPDDVVAAIDRAAAARGVTRSRLVSDVLRAVARARSEAETRARVDRLVAEPQVAAEQRGTARAFQRAGSRWGAEW